MNDESVMRALLAAAGAILDDVGIQVDERRGEMSWPDPAVVPYGPRPVDPDRLMQLARAVSAARRHWATGTLPAPAAAGEETDASGTRPPWRTAQEARDRVVELEQALTEIRRLVAAMDEPHQDYGDVGYYVEKIDEVAARALGQKVEEDG